MRFRAFAVVGLLAASAGCPAQGDSAASVLGGVPIGAGAPPPSASAPFAPPGPGHCPDDAPWNGRVCLGNGYVACPGAARLDDAGACVTEARDAGATDASGHEGGPAKR